QGARVPPAGRRPANPHGEGPSRARAARLARLVGRREAPPASPDPGGEKEVGPIRAVSRRTGRVSAVERSRIVTEPLVTYRGAVYPSQCDHMGHMNVAWYVASSNLA